MLADLSTVGLWYKLSFSAQWVGLCGQGFSVQWVSRAGCHGITCIEMRKSQGCRYGSKYLFNSKTIGDVKHSLKKKKDKNKTATTKTGSISLKHSGYTFLICRLFLWHDKGIFNLPKSRFKSGDPFDYIFVGHNRFPIFLMRVCLGGLVWHACPAPSSAAAEMWLLMQARDARVAMAPVCSSGCWDVAADGAADADWLSHGMRDIRDAGMRELLLMGNVNSLHPKSLWRNMKCVFACCIIPQLCNDSRNSTLSPSGPCYWHGLTLIPAWISNHMLS